MLSFFNQIVQKLVSERMGYREFKLEIPRVPNIQLKLVFIFHFIFISWATLHPWATQVAIHLLGHSPSLGNTGSQNVWATLHPWATQVVRMSGQLSIPGQHR
jgi:hypothetical protein